MIFISTVLLIPYLVYEIINIIRDKNSKNLAPLLLVPACLLLIELIIRSWEIKFPARTNTYEALLFFSSSILFILGIRGLKTANQGVVSFGSAMISFIFLLLTSSPLIPSEVNPPIPALQSNWLLIHVTFSFIGEAFFVVSFISAIALLLTKTKSEYYRKLIINSITIGYPIYTAGAIIFGSIWASYAWGSFWSWDPKETWALITWIIYTIILHSKGSKKLTDIKLAWIAIIGYLVSFFTFFGVNYLLNSLHSYTG